MSSLNILSLYYSKLAVGCCVTFWGALVEFQRARHQQFVRLTVDTIGQKSGSSKEESGSTAEAPTNRISPLHISRSSIAHLQQIPLY